ncbi:MAG TPA: DNA polymerase III subunit delta [Candidatus Magasanikbacteria bacterium]|nr:DNA polymerase III subunit delta [Candidatus Magasanikbacteria bacterium]
MVIFLYGKDTFRSRETLHKMIAKFKTDRDPSGYNVVRFDALTEKPGLILTELHGSPFLAEKRMVIVEHALESKHTELHEKLEALISNEAAIPGTTICILFERTDTYKTKVQKELLKQLAKTKYAQHFEILEGSDLRQWILDHAKERNLTLEKNALDFIVLHSKGDAWFIHSLIEQLAGYCMGKPCTPDIVRMFLNETADDNIFNLVDAIVARKPQKVYAMIREQYDQGQDAHYIFAMLVRQFRIMLELKDALTLAPATPPDVLAKSIGLHPFVVKKTIPLLRSYTLKQLKTVYEELLSMDIKTKTGKGNMPVMIDMLVGKICVQ